MTVAAVGLEHELGPIGSRWSPLHVPLVAGDAFVRWTLGQRTIEVGLPFPLARFDEYIRRGEDDVFLQF